MIHGSASHRRLATCHPDLQKLVIAAAEDFDLIVVCGHRGEQDQEAAVRNGTSWVNFPNSYHNSDPADAVDLAPYPLNWEDLGRFDKLGAHVLATAERIGVPVVWGGVWKGKKKDRPHFQRVRGSHA